MVAGPQLERRPVLALERGRGDARLLHGLVVVAEAVVEILEPGEHRARGPADDLEAVGPRGERHRGRGHGLGPHLGAGHGVQPLGGEAPVLGGRGRLEAQADIGVQHHAQPLGVGRERGDHLVADPSVVELQPAVGQALLGLGLQHAHLRALALDGPVLEADAHGLAHR
ncbi:MAG: hypothetical protein V9E93_16625 [Steroidobacteraceae bacterium]